MDAPQKQSPIKGLFNALKAILFTRVPLTLLWLIVIVALSVASFNYLNPEKTPTGQAILEQQQCPECICEEEECEQDCDLCPVKTQIETKNVIKYQCPGGALVERIEDCQNLLPSVSDEYSGTVEGVTLSIEDIEYEREAEDSGFVTSIRYTIINKKKLPIVPQLQVKVYSDWSSKIKALPPNKIIYPELVVNSNDYLKREDSTQIYFKGKKQTLSLRLVDTLPEPPKEIITVTREFEMD